MAQNVTEQLREALLEKQKLIHHGQYHQWTSFEICRNEDCVKIKELVEHHATEYRISSQQFAKEVHAFFTAVGLEVSYWNVLTAISNGPMNGRQEIVIDKRLDLK